MKLIFEKRDVKVRPDKVREQGKIPAVFYGRKEASTTISVVAADFKKLWREAGESTVITLSGSGEDHDALIHAVDLNPVTDEPRHIDFYIIEKGKKVEVSVSLEFDGVSAAVKELGGTLIKVVHEIEVEAMPKDLPQHLTVDISLLKELGDTITVKDIVIPAGVKVLADLEEVVATVAAPKEEVEEVAPVADLTNIEVAKKGKKEEEGEEAKAE